MSRIAVMQSYPRCKSSTRQKMSGKNDLRLSTVSLYTLWLSTYSLQVFPAAQFLGPSRRTPKMLSCASPLSSGNLSSPSFAVIVNSLIWPAFQPLFSWSSMTGISPSPSNAPILIKSSALKDIYDCNQSAMHVSLHCQSILVKGGVFTPRKKRNSLALSHPCANLSYIFHCCQRLTGSAASLTYK